MNLRGKIVLAIFLFGGVFLGISKNSIFAIADCAVEGATEGLAGSTVSVRIGLPTPVNSGTPTVCPGDAGSDPAGGICFQVRACDYGSSLSGCTANVNYKVIQQEIVGDDIVATIQMPNSSTLGYTGVRYELQQNDQTGGRSSNRKSACNWQNIITLKTNPAVCGTGTFSVTDTNGNANYTNQSALQVHFDGSKTSNFAGGGAYNVFLQTIDGQTVASDNQLNPKIVSSNSQGQLIYSSNSLSGVWSVGPFNVGDYRIIVMDRNLGNFIYCSDYSFKVSADGNNSNPATGDPVTFALCKQTADAGSSDPQSDYQQCITCTKGKENLDDPNTQGYWTAFGCVKTTAEGVVTSFLKIGLGMAGGFVLLSILYGAFLLSTSSGEPKRVEEGQQMISSAVMGLLFVIFSVIILQFIGVSILQIPGFGT